MKVYLFNVEKRQDIIQVKDDEDVNTKFDDWLREEVEGGFILYELVREPKISETGD